MRCCYESCPWCRIARPTSWQAVQRATIVPRMPPSFLLWFRSIVLQKFRNHLNLDWHWWCKVQDWFNTNMPCWNDFWYNEMLYINTIYKKQHKQIVSYFPWLSSMAVFFLMMIIMIYSSYSAASTKYIVVIVYHSLVHNAFPNCICTIL